MLSVRLGGAPSPPFGQSDRKFPVFLTLPFQARVKKIWEKAARLTALVDPPLHRSGQENGNFFTSTFDFLIIYDL